MINGDKLKNGDKQIMIDGDKQIVNDDTQR